MPQLGNAVIRMKLEKLKLELDATPGSDVSLDQRIAMLHAKMKMLVEILLHANQ